MKQLLALGQHNEALIKSLLIPQCHHPRLCCYAAGNPDRRGQLPRLAAVLCVGGDVRDGPLQ